MNSHSMSMFHPMQELDAVLPLALFLAHERNKGQGSFWQPYLGLLPEQPGCAWLMSSEELTQALQQVKQLVGESWFGQQLSCCSSCCYMSSARMIALTEIC